MVAYFELMIVNNTKYEVVGDTHTNLKKKRLSYMKSKKHETRL